MLTCAHVVSLCSSLSDISTQSKNQGASSLTANNGVLCLAISAGYVTNASYAAYLLFKVAMHACTA